MSSIDAKHLDTLASRESIIRTTSGMRIAAIVSETPMRNPMIITICGRSFMVLVHLCKNGSKLLAGEFNPVDDDLVAPD